MARYYLVQDRISEKEVVLPPSENHHLQHVLRKKVGDEILAADGAGTEYQLRIIDFDEEQGCHCEIIHKRLASPEQWQMELWLPLLKQNRHLWVAEKATEIGVKWIVPYVSDRVIIRKNFDKHHQKLENTVQAAVKQCGCASFPKVLPVRSLKEHLAQTTNQDAKICAWEGEDQKDLFQLSFFNQPLETAKQPLQLALLTGPEGGFSFAEADTIQNAGFELIGLGQRILRAETAAIFLLSALHTLRMEAEKRFS